MNLRILVLSLVLLMAAATGMPAGAANPIDPALAARIAALEHETNRLDAVRQVKRVQLAYGHFAEFGLWDQMADLFAARGVLQIGQREISGRRAILAYLTENFGGGRLGLVPGSVTTRLQLTPVVSLSADGRSARGRWHELAMRGELGGEGSWSGGISENDYVLEDGRWKIARLHLYPMYAGSYEEGWRALEADIRPVPVHFTPDSAGMPFSAPRASAPSRGLPRDAESAARRLEAVRLTLARIGAEAAAVRMQNIYGYYRDQKMWNDIEDLFTGDGTREIVGVGRWTGPQSIRRSYGSEAATGLGYGEVREHLQLAPIVTVAPNGREAWVRVFELGVIGQNNVGAWWTHGIVNTHMVKGADDLWRIKEMRVYPKLRTDYYQGWHRNQLPEPSPAAGYEPDAPSKLDLPRDAAWLPAFGIHNPGTGRPITYPSTMAVVGESDGFLPVVSPETAPEGIDAGTVAELERQLAVAKAHDGVENVSHAFGNFLDDFDWAHSSQLFARTGRRGKYQVGFYVGPERIYTAESGQYGPLRSPRTSVQIHLRVQPVIDVAPDGMSAKLRTRLFSMNASVGTPGSFQGAMYPNDRLVMQDGVWKFQHQSIDEFYFRSAGYKNGWGKVPEIDQSVQFAPDRQPTIMDRLRTTYPPDVNILDMGLRGVGFAPNQEFVDFPRVKPMWFHYTNPVSGREPPNYCPDHSTCYQREPLFEDQEPTPFPPER
jgi:hypothetical protein